MASFRHWLCMSAAIGALFTLGAARADDAAPGIVDRTGRAIDHAAQKTGEVVRPAAEKTGAAVKKVGDKVGTALDKADKKIQHTVDKDGKFQGKPPPKPAVSESR